MFHPVAAYANLRTFIQSWGTSIFHIGALSCPWVGGDLTDDALVFSIERWRE